jgi:hypothetical protein
MSTGIEEVHFPLNEKKDEHRKQDEEETKVEPLPEEDIINSYFTLWIRFFQEADFLLQKPQIPFARTIDLLLSQLFPASNENNKSLYLQFFSEFSNPDEAWYQTTYIAHSAINKKQTHGRMRRYFEKSLIEEFEDGESYVRDAEDLIYSMKQNLSTYEKRLRLEWTMTFFNMLQILTLSLMLRRDSLCEVFDTIEDFKSAINDPDSAWGSGLDGLDALWHGNLTCQKQLFYELIACVVHGSPVYSYCKVLNLLCEARYYHINFLWECLDPCTLYVSMISPSYIGAFPTRFINKVYQEGQELTPFLQLIDQNTMLPIRRRQPWSSLVFYFPNWTHVQKNDKMSAAITRFFQRLQKPIYDHLKEEIHIHRYFVCILLGVEKEKEALEEKPPKRPCQHNECEEEDSFPDDGGETIARFLGLPVNEDEIPKFDRWDAEEEEAGTLVLAPPATEDEVWSTFTVYDESEIKE